MARPINDDTGAIDKLGSLLPAEVTGLYVSVRALFLGPGIADQSQWIIGCAVVSLIVGLAYIRFVRKVTNGIHLLIYAVLFANWALTLDVARFEGMVPPGTPLTSIAAAASVILSFALPFIIPSRTVASSSDA